MEKTVDQLKQELRLAKQKVYDQKSYLKKVQAKNANQIENYANAFIEKNAEIGNLNRMLEAANRMRKQNASDLADAIVKIARIESKWWYKIFN